MAEHRGGTWCQGDCVLIDAPDAFAAVAEYRRRIAESLIGISSLRPDGVRLDGLLLHVRRLRGVIELYLAAHQERDGMPVAVCQCDACERARPALKVTWVDVEQADAVARVLEVAERYVLARSEDPGLSECYEDLEAAVHALRGARQAAGRDPDERR